MSMIRVYPSVGHSLQVHKKSIKKVVRALIVGEVMPEIISEIRNDYMEEAECEKNTRFEV